MHSFVEKVDKRSREDMTGYLIEHFRYHTLSSWNASTSYAHKVKIHSLALPSALQDIAYDLISVDETFELLSDLIEEWGREHDYLWQAGFNGRSGGYLVLYQGGREKLEYKSYCRACGQRNYKLVEEYERCGKCGEEEELFNLERPIYRPFVYSGRGTDMYKEYEDWDMESLRARVRVVQEFDQLVQDVFDEFVYLCEHYHVVEEEIMVPKTVRVLQERIEG